jgi:hypothetical protein
MLPFETVDHLSVDIQAGAQVLDGDRIALLPEYLDSRLELGLFAPSRKLIKVAPKLAKLHKHFVPNSRALYVPARHELPNADTLEANKIGYFLDC